jgi:hypothetical protein
MIEGVLFDSGSVLMGPRGGSRFIPIDQTELLCYRLIS